MVSVVLFYSFAAILVLSCLRVVTAKNPVHAVLFLVLAFVTSSCLWLMLNVEFLALALILIYVGAVMVLFLFIVMMLDVDTETLRKGFWKNFPLALVLGVIVLAEMLLVLLTKPLVISNSTLATDQMHNQDINQLFWLLYTQYSFPVELASLILLLGLVVAVAVTLRPSNKQAKRQIIAQQVAASPKGRVEMVNLKAEVEVPLTEAIEQQEVGK
ncbi:MAG: NADH-quinone oxidoreductase subunit J [Burkholderiales bacterium]